MAKNTGKKRAKELEAEENEVMEMIDDKIEPSAMTQREALDFLANIESMVNSRIEAIREDIENAG